MKSSSPRAAKMSDHYEMSIPHSEVKTKAILDRMRRYVNIAKALHSNGYDSNGRTFNCCFAAKKSKLLSIGINDYKRVMVGYNRTFKTNIKHVGDADYKMCLHAEISALLKLGTDDASDLDFYILRLSQTGHCLGNTFPCSNCLRMLKLVNAKNIFCYDEDMKIVRLEV